MLTSDCCDLLSSFTEKRLYISDDGKIYPTNYQSFPNITEAEIKKFLSFDLDTFLSMINRFIGSNPFVSNPETIMQIVFNNYIGYILSIEDCNKEVIAKITDNIEFVINLFCQKPDFRLKKISTSLATTSFYTPTQVDKPYLKLNISNNSYVYPASFNVICYFIQRALTKYKYNKDEKDILKKAMEDMTGIKYTANSSERLYLSFIRSSYIFNRKLYCSDEACTILYNSICIIDRYGDAIIVDKLTPIKMSNYIEAYIMSKYFKKKASIIKNILLINTGTKRCIPTFGYKQWDKFCKEYVQQYSN